MKTLVFIFAPYLALAAEGGPTFTHNPASKTGPPGWGAATASYATCGTTIDGKFIDVGKRQSPIDVATSSALASTLAPVQMQYEPTALTVENNGHVLEVPYKGGGGMKLGQSPLVGQAFGLPFATDVYTLVQFHFHTPSEHTINGKQADMELHLVHQNGLGDLSVVGVMMNRGTNANTAVDQIVAAAPAKVSGVTVPGATVNPRNMLPESFGYYAYSGSLTTPPCSEGVRWILLKDQVNVSDFAVRQMRSIVGQLPGYEGAETNSRPVTPLNGRPVLSSR